MIISRVCFPRFALSGEIDQKIKQYGVSDQEV